VRDILPDRRQLLEELIHMGDLSKNISDHEVRCPCGECFVTIHAKARIIKDVQTVCDVVSAVIGDPVACVIHSGARCYEYNRTDGIGSGDGSYHPRCEAIDFHIEEVPVETVEAVVEALWPDSHGLGVYTWGVHLDSRANWSRWRGTT
jgi:uncharacterized protein YcbK (DUF882 family)